MGWKISMLFSFAVATNLLLLWDIHLDCGIKHGIVEYGTKIFRDLQFDTHRSPFSISYYIEQEKKHKIIHDHSSKLFS